MSRDLYPYLRLEVFPTPFCSGCGHGILLGAIVRAINECGLDWKRLLFVSGIGCAAWIPSPHFQADTLHTLHGRPVAFGTGAYLGNKNLKVIVISGDGDLVAIGGNHLIHAARRNLPLTVICANNSIYGMTGGQVAPTTPLGGCTLTSPWGSDEPAFDLCRLVEGAGAKFVGRHTVFQIHQLIKTLSLALKFNGFSFVEVISPCPTHYGKLNDIPTLADFRRIMKDQYLDRRRWEKLSAEDQQKTIPTGVLVNIPQNEKPESSPGKGERVKAEGGK